MLINGTSHLISSRRDGRAALDAGGAGWFGSCEDQITAAAWRRAGERSTRFRHSRTPARRFFVGLRGDSHLSLVVRHGDVNVDALALRARRIHRLEPNRRTAGVWIDQILVAQLLVSEHSAPERQHISADERVDRDVVSRYAAACCASSTGWEHRLYAERNLAVLASRTSADR
jgi:hypothetical protein